MNRLIVTLALLATALCAQDWIPYTTAVITSYLPLARMAKVTGDVVIRCTLNEDGTVASAEVVSGHALLREEARQNALVWKFRRTSTGGDRSITLTYQFRLEGNATARNDVSFTVTPPNLIRIIGTPAPPLDTNP